MRKLLKESDIRQMMKLANIPALSDGFINKLHETSLYDEDQLEEQAPPGEEEDVLGDVPPDEAGGPVPPGPEAGGMTDPDDPMSVAGDDEGMPGGVTVESALEGLGAFLEGAADPEIGPQLSGRINVSMSGEADAAASDVPPDLGDEGPEADVQAAGGDDLGGMPPDEELSEVELEEDDALVSEVMRRVARRLTKRR